MIDTIEEREIGIDFRDPIALHEDYGTDIKQTEIATQERLILDPCHDIVHLPGGYDQRG